MARYWYAFQGGTSDTNPSNYLRVANFNPEDICFGGATSCTIYSRPNSANPNIPSTLSNNLLNYLIAAKGLSSEYPVTPQKAYVYTKL